MKKNLKHITKKLSLAFTAILLLTNITKAQKELNEYKRPLREIVQSGGNIIIPDYKLSEFLKNNRQKQTKTLSKPTDITLDGYVTDPLTKQPLEGIKITADIYDGETYLGTYGPTYTDNQGYYIIDNIVKVEDTKQTETTGEIKYLIESTPQIELNLNKLSKVEIKLYDILGQEVKTLLNEETKQKTINADINKLSSGVYILQTIIDGKAYNNQILKTGNRYNYGKTRQGITKGTETTNNLEKTITIGAVMEFKDTTNTRYSFGPSGLGEFENYTPRRNMTLPTVIPLQTPFTDPEVPYNIEDIIDLWKYMSRIQGPQDHRIYIKSLWPLGIFTDTTNTPQTWKQYINNAVNIVKDSIGIQADSILIIKNQYTDPFSGQQFSAINIIYMDSTQFKNHFGINAYAGGGFFYSGPEDAFTEYTIYLNTEKITNPIDAQK